MISEKTLVHLHVGDTIRSVAFYEALFGAAPARRSSTTTTFDLDSPPLLLTLEANRRTRQTRFTLVVNEARHVGDTAIALRRAGVPIRIEDHGIAANDPDQNAWQVRFVPSAPGRAVFEGSGQEPRTR